MLPLIGAIHDENEYNRLTIDEAFECFMLAVSGGARYGTMGRGEGYFRRQWNSHHPERPSYVRKTHAVQKTEQKPSFGIAIRGDEEGTGKSIIFEELRKLFGLDNSFSTADPEEIFGANNPGMDSCVFLLLEEVEWAMYRRYANKLRNLYTTPTINVKDKYEKQFVQGNFTRIAISGNAEHIMQVSRTGRRTTVFDAAPTRIGDTEYFATLKTTFDSGGREALMFKLLHRNIENFDPYKPLYTKELDEQKELSLGPVAEFWLDECLEEGKLPYDEELKTVDGEIVNYKVIIEKLVWCFNDWQKRRGERPFSEKSFGKQFRKIVPKMRPARDVKVQPEWVKKQCGCYEIMSLSVCRYYFANYQGLKHKIWDDTKEFEQAYVDKALWWKGW